MPWPVYDAKARFSEFLETTLKEEAATDKKLTAASKTLNVKANKTIK